jgi:peptidoglycan/LPS O-acetylase OafA/YrhL
MISLGERPPALHWLTALRYPAAVWVVLIHSLNGVRSTMGCNPLPESLLNTFIERGYLGVSFFFMLSGFILTWNYPIIKSKRSYLIARASRVLPVYYLSLLFALPILISGIIKQGINLKVLVKSGIVITLTQSWIPDLSAWWNGPAWTLSCEAFFYLILPFILPFMANLMERNSKNKAVFLLFALWLIGLIAPIWFICKYGTQLNPDFTADQAHEKMSHAKLFVERFPLLRVIEFLAGVVLCIGFRRFFVIYRPKLGIGLIFLGIIWIFSSFKITFILSMGTWCLPGFAMIISGAALTPWSGSPPWIFKPILLLGNASYALYLFHVPARDYLLIITKHIGFCNALTGSQLLILIFILCLTSTTLLSIAIYLHFEEPARKIIKTLDR